METIIITSTILVGALALWLTWLWKKTQATLLEVLKNQKEIERKFDYFDRHWLETLHEVEKKIRSSGDDVEKVKDAFSRFQSKFLEFDQKVDKIFKKTYESNEG